MTTITSKDTGTRRYIKRLLVQANGYFSYTFAPLSTMSYRAEFKPVGSRAKLSPWVKITVNR